MTIAWTLNGPPWLGPRVGEKTRFIAWNLALQLRGKLDMLWLIGLDAVVCCGLFLLGVMHAPLQRFTRMLNVSFRLGV